jgi:hypothetical protein
LALSGFQGSGSEMLDFWKLKKYNKFGLARSLRGLCKNKNFSSRTPARRKILARNGLSSLGRNITARPCETLLLPNLTGPKGGLRPSKRGVEPAFWAPAASYRNNTLFLLRTDSTYLCHIRSCISWKTRVARRDPGLARKVTYLSCKVSQQDQTLRPVLSQQKTGTIFRYDFVAGGQIVPKICLCDRIEKDGWDGCQGQKFVRGSVNLYRGDSSTNT